MAWGTPQWLFDKLDAQYHFDLDVCADADNAKCERFWTEAHDALVQDWSAERGTLWMNPPYDSAGIAAFTKKAADTVHAENKSFTSIVGLVPAATETRWWRDNVMRAYSVTFLIGRVQFAAPDEKNGTRNAPIGSAVVEWWWFTSCIRKSGPIVLWKDLRLEG